MQQKLVHETNPAQSRDSRRPKPPAPPPPPKWTSYLIWIGAGLTLLLIGVYMLIARRAQRQVAGGIGGIIGSRAKVYDAEKPSTRFADVAGYEGAKREIAEVVDFLKKPERYSRVGAKGPRGVLLVG